MLGPRGKRRPSSTISEITLGARCRSYAMVWWGRALRLTGPSSSCARRGGRWSRNRDGPTSATHSMTTGRSMIIPPSDQVPLGPDQFGGAAGWYPYRVPSLYHPLRGVSSGPGHPRENQYISRHQHCLPLSNQGTHTGRSESPTDSRDDGLPIHWVRCHSRGERGLLGTASALPDQSKVLTRGSEHPWTQFGLSPEIQTWARHGYSSRGDGVRASCATYQFTGR